MVVLLKRSVHSRKCGRVLVLIWICSFIHPHNCQDIAGDSTVTEATAATEAKPQAEVGAANKPPTPAANDIESLTEDKCLVKRKGCCEEMYLDSDEVLMKCFTLHQSKIPQENDKDPQKIFKFISCWVECLYKQKKYIGKGDTMNMKMIRADAAKMFANRPKEKAYYIKMYEFCRNDAKTMYNMIKMNPAGQIILKDNCRPYLIFVFLCEVEYHKKKTCPYFRWQDERKTTKVDCLNAKNKCYEIDGIEI